LGELTSRALGAIIGLAMAIVGVVGMSETIHPTKTSLSASTLAVRLFGPILLVTGLAVFALARRIPAKRRPTPLQLVLVGAASALTPGVIWIAGSSLANRDSAFWAPVVAAGLLLLTVPGLGMAIGGTRRLFERDATPSHPAPPAPKVRRRK
jgi:hypothetical protein